jgi:hypothetical protein
LERNFEEMNMKELGVLMILLLAQIVFNPLAVAGDYDWMDNLNITAKADSSGFHVRLATRFHIGNAEVTAVIGDVSQPSDAYMIFRLSELSHRPVAEVMKVYRKNRKRGWGAMAKGLGIKPGSREFHALKRGHDMGDDHASKGGNFSGKGKANDKGKNKGKGKKDKGKK